jgi:acyl dehydratase
VVALNQALIGKTYLAEGTFEVSREHIRRFADAIGDANPAYRDAAAARALGHPDVIAPPTFLTTVGLSLSGDGPIEDPDLGVDYSRLVHGEQTFVHRRPVVPGDVLQLSTTIESIRVAGRNEVLSLRSDIADASGETVCIGYNVVVSRGTAVQPSDT